MLPLIVTPPVLALLLVMLIALAVLVIRQRRRAKSALGDNGDMALARAIAAHRNFAESAPLFALALLVAEAMAIPAMILGFCALLFIGGRLSHAYSLLVAEPNRGVMNFRIGGMAASFTALLSLALCLLAAAIGI